MGGNVNFINVRDLFSCVGIVNRDLMLAVIFYS